MNVERVKIFIRVMETVRDKDAGEEHKHFDISTWADKNISNGGVLNCHTTACALGWLALDKEANELGLKWERKGDYRFWNIWYGEFNYEGAAIGFLDLSSEFGLRIMENILYPSGYGSVVEVTPQHVLDKLNYLLEVGEEQYFQNFGRNVPHYNAED